MTSPLRYLCAISCIAAMICASPITLIPSIAPLTEECGTSNDIPMEHAKIHFFGIEGVAPLYVYGRSQECYKCLYLPLSLTPLTAFTPLCVILDTHFPFSIGYSSQQPFSGCHPSNITCAWQPNNWTIEPVSYHYDEYYEYQINITGNVAAVRSTVKTASNKYIPIYILLAVIFFVILCYNIYQFYLTDYLDQSRNEERLLMKYDSDEQREPDMDNGKKKKPQRFISLDAFRGMSLIIMIFVNYGGGGYWWLAHSKWNGLTVADLVFPWFIFIMGTAMAIVFPRKLRKIAEEQRNAVQFAMNEDSKAVPSRFTLLNKIVSRGLKLFFIGLFIINQAFDLPHMRVPGVLQYFAISYVLNSLIIVFTEPLHHNMDQRTQPSAWNLFIPEVTLYWKQWLIASCILLINLCLVFLLPVTMYNEKCPKGYMGPGGIGDYGKHVECTGGAHRYVDEKVFGHNHVYKWPTCRQMYATGWYDPEGFLGSLTATILTFFGLLVGRILTVYKTHSQRVCRWFMWCIVFGAIAGGLCGFSQNDGVIPVNKNLWSVSFICCQASTGIFVLILFYVLIDVKNVWSGLPFHWLGSNSIIIYTGSEVFDGYFPWGFSYGDQDHYKLLLSNVIGVSLWIALAGYLFHKKIFYAL